MIGVAYAKIWFLEWFGMVYVAGYKLPGRQHLRYLWALALVMSVIGTVFAMLFSSVGPILYDRLLGGDRFSGLEAALATYPANNYVTVYADYLWQNYVNGTAQFGTGISAMPSVHVAVATTNALYLSGLDRRLGVAGWIFAGIIMFGSVYTGWHYALGSAAAAMIAGLIWKRTAFLARPDAPADRDAVANPA